jgi:hypothetical protein
MVNRLIFTNLLIFLFIFSCDQNKSADTSAGDNWQLFIDGYWISNSDNVIKTLHQPTKHPDNPLIRGDDPWAQNPYCFGSVIYDEDESLFKLWYMSYNFGQAVEERTPVLYATSPDGLQWTRPKLGLFEFQNSTENNIVLTNYGHHDLYSPSVIKDIAAIDPDRRYKMIWWDFPLGNRGYQDDGMCVAFSPDGIHWSKYSKNPVLHARKCEQSISDVMSVMQDQRTGRFVAYTKGWADPWPAFRQIVRTESSDFINWSEPKVVIRHKYDIQDPQSYGMTVTQVGNLYIGLMCSYKKPGDETIDIQLAISHDNLNWERVSNQLTFLPNGSSGAWDSGMIFTAPLINHGTQTLIYYGGWDRPHNLKNRHSGIGLAFLRKNGFVSIDAGTEQGIILTHLMKNAQGPLLVNVDADSGSLRAELLDAQSKPIPGYTLNDCIPVQSDGLEEFIRWRDHNDLPDPEKGMRIRFLINNASLFGFYAGQNLVRHAE